MANLWIMLSWIVDGTVAMMLCIIIGFLWLISFVYFSHREFKLNMLEFKLDRLKSHAEDLEYKQIVKLLEVIAFKGSKKKPRRKQKKEVKK